jgi:hypothetical protein
VKDTFKPHQLAARDELLCTAGEYIVGSPDGVSFKGTGIKEVTPLLEGRDPLWT